MHVEIDFSPEGWPFPCGSVAFGSGCENTPTWRVVKSGYQPPPASVWCDEHIARDLNRPRNGGTATFTATADAEISRRTRDGAPAGTLTRPGLR
jgi:hypothetical protein